MNLPNIVFIGDQPKFIETKDGSRSYLMFNKDKEYLEDSKTFDTFTKHCEQYIRTSDDYKEFIKWIKNVVGLNFCAVSPQIVGSDKVEIEMHHGPLFTLYDCVSCAIEFRLDRRLRINTFTVADQVLQDHFDLIISIVMLAKTYHEAVHNRDIFLNINQRFGDITGFLDKYAAYLDDNQKYKVYQYMKFSKENPSFNNGILDIENIKPYLAEVA